MDIDIIEKILGLLQHHGPLATLAAGAVMWALDERRQRKYLQSKLLKLTAAALARSRHE